MKVCKNCEKKFKDAYEFCPQCGVSSITNKKIKTPTRIKNENTKFIFIGLAITIIFLMIIVNLNNSDNVESKTKSSPTYTKNTTTTNQITTLTTSSTNNYMRKTYNTTKNEYKDYIKDIIKKNIITNDVYQLRAIGGVSPYIRVYIDYFKPIEKAVFDSKNKEIADLIFTMLKENDYKGGKFSDGNNIISLEFYSNEINCKAVCAQNDFIQIDVLKIKNSNTLEEYLRK